MKLKGLYIFTAIFFLSSYCFAKDSVVSVVISSDLDLYKEVEGGFSSFLAEKGMAAHIKEHGLAGQEANSVLSAVSAENPALIFAIGEAGLKSAKQLNNGIPIVFSMVYDASTYANQNISGVLLEIPVEMKVAAIKKAFPKAKTIGLLYSQNSAAVYEEISGECEKQGLMLNAKPVNSEAEFSGALSSALAGSDCFLVIVDVKIYFSQTIKLLLLESANKKVPVIGLSSFFTKAGAAMSFDSDYKDLGRQAGEIAVKVLLGESGIKTVRPRKYRYSLNLATAEKLGIVFPQSVVRDASEVFK